MTGLPDGVLYRDLRVPQAHVGLLEGLSTEELDLARLIEETPWQQPVYRYGGAEVPQPRLSCWMGDTGADYTFSGRKYSPIPWFEGVATMGQRIADALGVQFNSCLLNYYRDGEDSISQHSDNELELGHNPTIAAVSLGEERVLVFKSTYREFPPVKVPLADRSVLVMSGRTQRLWTHGIAKDRKRQRGPRVSLTYRLILGR